MPYFIESPMLGSMIQRGCAPADHGLDGSCETLTENGQTATVCVCNTSLCNSAESNQATTMPTTIQPNQTTTNAPGTGVY